MHAYRQNECSPQYNQSQVRWLVTEAALYKPGGEAGGGAGGVPMAGPDRLLYGPEDVGTRLKVWWGKDKVFYSGTITEWNHG